MAERFQTPPATHDILPAEQHVWYDSVLATMERLARSYGYRRIQTPVFEDTDLFKRTSGVGSDVVQKEMYTFTDRGDRSLTLRPEGTAPICRAYLQHGMQREPQLRQILRRDAHQCVARQRRGIGSVIGPCTGRLERSDVGQVIRCGALADAAEKPRKAVAVFEHHRRAGRHRSRG